MYFATAEEMEQLDAIAVRHGLEIRQMMELAGWHMLNVFKNLKIFKDQKVVVVCGKGNKGGDGLSSARHLLNHGYDVSVILASEDLKTDPFHHLKLLRDMNCTIVVASNKESTHEKMITNADVLIDALIGYHLNGAPKGIYAELITQMNNPNSAIIAYDMPSGVDADTGECITPCIQAKATLTLAMPKKCFETLPGKKASGKLFVADIGIPVWMYDEIVAGSRPIFNTSGYTQLS